MVSYAIPYEKAVSDRPLRWRVAPSAIVPAPKAQGRPRNHSLRDVLDAIFYYVLKRGRPFLMANTEPALEQEGLYERMVQTSETLIELATRSALC